MYDSFSNRNVRNLYANDLYIGFLSSFYGIKRCTFYSLPLTKIRYADILKAGNSHLSIGKLLINGNDLFKYNFGGPFLYNDTLIIIPVYTKGLFFSGFKIAQINLEDCNIQIKGKLNDFIFLQKVENGKIYYCIDLEKKKREMINI